MPQLRKSDLAHIVGEAVQRSLMFDPEDDPQGSLLGLITLSDLVRSDSRVDPEDE
jgi:hypothetical protein